MGYGIAPQRARVAQILDMMEESSKAKKVPVRAQESLGKATLETEITLNKFEN
jgi:hypothetical protein